MKTNTETEVKFDYTTEQWFLNHYGSQSTVEQCDKCGLFYKPSIDCGAGKAMCSRYRCPYMRRHIHMPHEVKWIGLMKKLK